MGKRKNDFDGLANQGQGPPCRPRTRQMEGPEEEFSVPVDRGRLGKGGGGGGVTTRGERRASFGAGVSKKIASQREGREDKTSDFDRRRGIFGFKVRSHRWKIGGHMERGHNRPREEGTFHSVGEKKN